MVGILQLIAFQIHFFAPKARDIVHYCESRKLGVFVQCCVGDVHVPVGGKVRVKRKTEQAFLSLTISIQRDNRSRQYSPTPVDQDIPGLFAYIDVAIWGKGNHSGFIQAVR